MCQFNSGCPGIESDDGFVPCTVESGCASGTFVEQEFVNGEWVDVVESTDSAGEYSGYSHACGYHN